jgi:hypothetical protein
MKICKEFKWFENCYRDSCKFKFFELFKEKKWLILNVSNVLFIFDDEQFN